MKILKQLITILTLSFLVTPTAYAMTVVPWIQNTLTDTFITPANVNGLVQGILINASSTFQNLTFSNATGTNATTTNLFASFASTTNLRANIGNIGNLTVGSCTGCSAGVTAVTATYPILSTGGATPVISIAFGTTTANSWSLLNQFNMSSTTVASFGNAYFGKTATSSFDGTGALTVIASTTLQNFTASNATTSQATTTNLSLSANHVTLGTGNVFVGSTTQKTLAFASSTLFQGFSLSIAGTTTMPMGANRETIRLVGIGCQASTTAGGAGGFLVKLGTATGTYTETNFCDTNYREYTLSTNVNITGHVPQVMAVSKASTTPDTGWVTIIFQKMTDAI